MKKWLKRHLKNEKGLTLVELLAVIVILGIIAAIAVPSIGGIIDNTRIKAANADAQNIISAANLYFAENPDSDEVKLSVLKTEKYVDDTGSFGETEVTLNRVAGGNTISGTATWKNGKTVVYNNATVANINTAGSKTGTNVTVNR